MNANTRQATGNENFCWMAMISGCGEIPFWTLVSIVRAELGDRLLVDPALEFDLREHGLRIQRQDQVAREPVRSSASSGLRDWYRVPFVRTRSTVALGPVEHQPAAPAPDRARSPPACCVSATSTSFQPACPVSGSSRAYRTQPGKVLEEHPRLDVVLDPLGDDVEGDFAGRSGWRPGWRPSSRRAWPRRRAPATTATGRSSR